MKRPEYVAVVTKVYAAAIREGREPTPAELRELQDAFSRSGFTQGYYQDHKGPDMFGTRTDTDPPEDLYATARESYRKENPLVGVDLTLEARVDRPLTATVRDEAGHSLQVRGDAPEPARTRATTQEEVQEQLSKTGGTPYFIQDLNATLDPGLALPKSTLNHLRRELLDSLTALRAQPPARRVVESDLPAPVPGPAGPPELIFSLRSMDQLTDELIALPHRFIDLPAWELARDLDRTSQALSRGARLRAVLPRVCWDSQRPQLDGQLDAIAQLGVRDALVPTWDLIPPARARGFTLYGDFGLGAYNSRTLEAMTQLGFAGATASFEMKVPMLRDLSKPLALEAIVYGRLPLMLLEQAPGGREQEGLTDRLGITFPLALTFGGRWELLNSQVLYLADKPEWKRLGLTATRLLFTDEAPGDCLRIAQAYQNGGQPPKGFTRGLYYRDVE